MKNLIWTKRKIDKEHYVYEYNKDRISLFKLENQWKAVGFNNDVNETFSKFNKAVNWTENYLVKQKVMDVLLEIEQ